MQELMVKITKMAGLVAAPFVYISGRILKNRRLEMLSTSFDDYYLRGIESRCQQNNVNYEEFVRFSVATYLLALSTQEVDQYLKNNISLSKSQLLQDIACGIIFKNKRDGTYIEVGVGDGVRHSNTHFLEHQLGWRGILVEPLPIFHAPISENRSATLVKCAASSVSNSRIKFYQTLADGEFSTSNVSGLGGGEKYETIYVETCRLQEIIDKNHFPGMIDYLSIDTEGTEIDVLEGIDFVQQRFGFITIEHNYSAYRRNYFISFLHKHGYQIILSSCTRFDSWFIAKELINPFR